MYTEKLYIYIFYLVAVSLFLYTVTNNIFLADFVPILAYRI